MRLHEKRPKLRQVDLYNVFAGVLYGVKTPCQWRALPKNFPKWRTGYAYFQIWSTPIAQDSERILEQVLKKAKQLRKKAQREAQTSCCIFSAQWVKNTASASAKGYDAGKKVSGIKRHLAVDSQGLPHGIHVRTAHVPERSGALEMMRRDPSKFTGVVIFWSMEPTVGANFRMRSKSCLELKWNLVNAMRGPNFR